MAEQDLVIEVDAPAPVEAAVAEKPAELASEKKPEAAAQAQPDPVADLKSQLDTLRAERTAETTRAQRAEAEAAAAKAEAATARSNVVDSNISAIDNGIAAATSEAEGYARDQEQAMASGKFADAAALGLKAARAIARAERLSEGKADLEARKAERASPQTATRPSQSDPFEKALEGATPRAQQWLRAHPTYVTDPSSSRKANIAHLKALDAGFVVDSDAYFDFCETELGLKAVPATNGAAKPEPKRQAKAMPSAPVSRDTTPSGGSLSSTAVTLTPGEQARATDGTLVWNYNDPNGKFKKGEAIGLKEFARRKIALQQSGAYDRSYVEN